MNLERDFLPFQNPSLALEGKFIPLNRRSEGPGRAESPGAPAGAYPAREFEKEFLPFQNSPLVLRGKFPSLNWRPEGPGRAESPGAPAGAYPEFQKIQVYRPATPVFNSTTKNPFNTGSFVDYYCGFWKCRGKTSLFSGAETSERWREATYLLSQAHSERRT